MFLSKRIPLGAVISFAAGLQFVSAQSISTQCQSTLASFVSSSEAQCLAPAALVAAVVAGPSSSVVGPINNWLTNLCAQPACTNGTISALVSNVSTGCASDLQSMGLTMEELADLPSMAEETYPTARKVACLADTSNGNKLCMTETLTNLQPYTGTLTLSSIMSVMMQFASGSISNVPSNVTCTDCTRAAYDTINQAYPMAVSTNVNQSIASECGADFLTSAPPATVSQTANSDIASNKMNAAVVTRGSLFGMASSAMAAVFAFMLFA